MQKRSAIRFDMEEISDISNEIIEITGFYTKPTRLTTRNQLIFPIPKQIVLDLNLNNKDTVYFCQYFNGYYISFKLKPTSATKQQIHSRRLAYAGMNNTLYLCIPISIRHLYKEPITHIKLVHTKGFQPHEWQIQFLSTECI